MASSLVFTPVAKVEGEVVAARRVFESGKTRSLVGSVAVAAPVPGHPSCSGQ
jgi:hypothetical protein